MRVFLAQVAADARGADGAALSFGQVLGHWESAVTRVLRAGVGLSEAQVLSLARYGLPDAAWSSVRAVYAQGAANGWNQRRLSRELGHALSLRSATWTADGTVGASWQTRAETLARTEATAAYAEQSLREGKDNDARSKRWVTVGDSRVRPAHRSAQGQTVPLGGSFIVGGYAMAYPGDPSAPDDLRVGCRCVVVTGSS